MAVAYDIEAFATRLAGLSSSFAAKAAAQAAAPALRDLVHAQEAAGVSPDVDPWAALANGGGKPLRELQSEVTVEGRGSSIVMILPDWAHFHQGGFVVHTNAGARAEEKAAAAEAKATKATGTKIEKRDAKRKLKNLRAVRKATGTKVVARPPFPAKKSLPIVWGDTIGKAIEKMIVEQLEGGR